MLFLKRLSVVLVASLFFQSTYAETKALKDTDPWPWKVSCDLDVDSIVGLWTTERVYKNKTYVTYYDLYKPKHQKTSAAPYLWVRQMTETGFVVAEGVAYFDENQRFFTVAMDFFWKGSRSLPKGYTLRMGVFAEPHEGLSKMTRDEACDAQMPKITGIKRAHFGRYTGDARAEKLTKVGK